MKSSLDSGQIENLLKFCIKEVIMKDILSGKSGDKKTEELKNLMSEVMGGDASRLYKQMENR